MTERFAVYYAPPEDSALDRRATAWLGRDLTGAPVPRPALGLDQERVAAITRAPAFYGVHATLKPPFALAGGTDEDGLMAAVAALAADRSAFDAPPPRVTPLGTFLALRPAGPAPELDHLAADCVRALDAFRAPPSEAELARRRAGGLTERQETLLRDWGYPFVLDEFRFHMTLTGAVHDPVLLDTLTDRLTDWFGPILAEPLPIDGVAVFHQKDRDTPFTLRRRFAFTADGSN